MSMLVRADGSSIGSAHVHRPEIQGLRAVAVLAVIWAHANLPHVPGGFTGVDVFFVISGFLITRILLKEMEATGRIDLLAFWARRARRLLPNAFAALLGTLLLAVFLFPGYSPGRLAQDITLAALEIVNFHFADKAVDYFRSEDPASPVLHFWSLAVEEQFYMAWPVLLVVIGTALRQPFLRSATILLALIWCGSFIASLLLTHSDQPFAYFSTWTRCWQLATGALLAVGWPALMRLPIPLRRSLAWLGAIAIAAALALLNGAHYPAAWALLPTFGAAALIAGIEAAHPQGLLRRGLSAAPMQWIGARSYSWYLWHWPLLALPRATYPDSPYIEVIAVPASLVVACAAYSWIEVPVRDKRILAVAPFATLTGAAAGLGFIIAAAHTYLPALYAVDWNTADRMAQLDAADIGSQAEREMCQVGRKSTRQPDCLYGDVSASRRAVLFGDSHAMHWFEPLSIAARQNGWQLNVWTKSACPPAEVTLHYDGVPYTVCDEWREAMLARLKGPNRPDLVILSNATEYPLRIYDRGKEAQLPLDQAKEAWREGLSKALRRLLATGTQIMIIRDIPRADADYRLCLAKGDHCTRPRNAALGEPPLDEVMQGNFGGQTTVVDFTESFCDAEACATLRDGIIVYRDSTHLSARYAATFAPQMGALLRGFAERLPLATAGMK